MPSFPSHRTLRVLSLLALVALALSAGLSRLRTNDLFIHLVTGGLILDEGRVPDVDRYSFTAPGARYVTHEWLAATGYALGERAAGPVGAILASKTIPGLAILAALLAAFRQSRPAGSSGRRGVDPAIGVAVATAALAVARNRMTQDRPELIAIALLLILLSLLLRDRDRALEGAPDRVVFWGVPLTALWANVHASFPLGIALVAAFALADRIDAWLLARDASARRIAIAGAAAGLVVATGLALLPPASFGQPAALAVITVALLFAADAFAPLFEQRAGGADPDAAKRLGVLAAAMLAAVVLNPQGPSIYLFPFEFTAGVNPVTERIGEWRPLLEASFLRDGFELPTYLTWLALGAGALSLAALRGVLDRREIGVLLLFGVLPLRHIRWMGMFALVSAPAIAAMLSRARAARHASTVPSSARRVAAGVFALAALAALAGALSTGLTGPADPLFTSALLLAVAAAMLAWVIGAFDRPPGGARLALAALVCAALAGLAVARGIPGRRGSDLGLGFQWSGLDRVGGNLVPAADAVAFLRRNAIPGRLLTEYAWAGYAIHQLWPEVTVFLDSRSEVYGGELLATLLDMAQRPVRTRRALSEHAVDLVLVECRGYPYDDRMKHNAGILDVVSQDPDWGLLYFDDGAALFARRDASRSAPLPPVLEGVDPRTLTPPALARPDAALEATLREAHARAPRASLPRFALASQLHARGADDAALQQLDAAWRANPRQPAAPALAGRIAEESGDLEAARRWYDRALAAAPRWKAMQARRKALGT